MAERALTVDGFAQYQFKDEPDDAEPTTVAILQEVDGASTIHLRMMEHEAHALIPFHVRPGKPFMLHELAIQLFARGGISVVAGRIKQAEENMLTYRVVFRQGDDTWEEPVFSIDLIGYAIAAKVPIFIEEQLFGILSQNTPSLAELEKGTDKTNVQRMVERIAHQLGDGKLIKH